MKNIICTIKKRNIRIILCLIALFMLFTLCSCNNDNAAYDSYYNGSNESVGSTGSDFVIPDTERKIIYNADIYIRTDDLKSTYNKIKELYPENTWTSKEEINESSYTFTVRVKTEYFDSFISSLDEAGEISSIEKTSKDITSSYNKLTYRKQALETEYSRLIELMENSSADQITKYISPRLSEIETELLEINSSLSNYDERVEYSEINISISKNYKPIEEEDPTFFDVIKEGFFNGISGLGYVIMYGLGILLTVLPTAALLGLIALAGYKVYKIVKVKRDKNKKNTKDVKEDIEKNIEENVDNK